MQREPKNIAASVHQRLLKRARDSGRPFNEVLQYFAIERFIYRLSSICSTEKFEAMVKLGIINSRMKDFYDIWLLSRQFDFDGHVLATAIRKTFENRRTDIPSQPTVLQDSFAKDPIKETQWRAFISKGKLDSAPTSFAEAVSAISAFLEPLTAALAVQEDFSKTWKAPGPWQ